MIKIISWNVRHGLGQDGIVDIKRIGEKLKSLNADIIALQGYIMEDAHELVPGAGYA